MSILKDAVWVEKYRPRKVKDLVLSKERSRLLLRFIKEKHFPNLLFYGDVGSGKTTAALILASRIGSVSLELNSSDDRTITAIRDKVKDFVYHSSAGMRVVLLDECDGMLMVAQRALRRLMEKSIGNARFILTANYVHRVEPALRSRCTCLEFKPPPRDYVKEYLKDILRKERVKFSGKELKRLIDECYPDIRKCVRTLQLNCNKGRFVYEFSQDSGTITMLKGLLDEIKNGDIVAARELVIASNPDFDMVYRELSSIILKDSAFKDVRAGAFLVIGEYAYRDGVVVDRELNFSACCAELIELLNDEEEE